MSDYCCCECGTEVVDVGVVCGGCGSLVGDCGLAAAEAKFICCGCVSEDVDECCGCGSEDVDESVMCVDCGCVVGDCCAEAADAADGTPGVSCPDCRRERAEAV